MCLPCTQGPLLIHYGNIVSRPCDVADLGNAMLNNFVQGSFPICAGTSVGSIPKRSSSNRLFSPTAFLGPELRAGHTIVCFTKHRAPGRDAGSPTPLSSSLSQPISTKHLLCSRHRLGTRDYPGEHIRMKHPTPGDLRYEAVSIAG